MVNLRRKNTWALIFILIIATVARLWGINHQVHTDENKVIAPAVKLAKGEQTPLLYPQGSYYPHLYNYILGASFLPAALNHAPYPAAGTEVDVYTFIARVITALIGVATVYLSYKIGSELQGERLGLLAATLFAFLPLHVKYSHYVHVDTPVTFMMLLVTWSAFRIWKTGDKRWYITTGVLIGLSGATHYTGFVSGIALLIAHGARIMNTKPFTWRAIIRPAFIIALLIIPVSFAAGSPYSVIKWQQSKTIYEGLNKRGAAGDLGYTRPDFWWPIYTTSPDWGLPFTRSGVIWEFSPAICLAAIIALGISWYRRDWRLLWGIGGASVVIYLAIVSHLPLYAIKRLLPITPLVSILAAYTFSYLMGKGRPWMWASFAIIAGITAQNAWQAAGFDMAYAGISTHSTAVTWAKENLPHGSTVLQHTPIRLLNLDDPNYKIVRLDEVYASYNAKDPEVSHDRAKPIETWVNDKHVDFIAMDSRLVDRYYDATSIELYPETTASYRAFYDDIRRRGKLMYRITPELFASAGPQVEIYDVRNLTTPSN